MKSPSQNVGNTIRQWWALSLALAITLVRVRRYRMSLMLGITITAILMVGLGAKVIDGWLAESVWRFGIYWLICFGLCLFMLGLAMIEMAGLRKTRGDEERVLEIKLREDALRAAKEEAQAGKSAKPRSGDVD